MVLITNGAFIGGIISTTPLVAFSFCPAELYRMVREQPSKHALHQPKPDASSTLDQTTVCTVVFSLDITDGDLLILRIVLDTMVRGSKVQISGLLWSIVPADRVQT